MARICIFLPGDNLATMSYNLTRIHVPLWIHHQSRTECYGSHWSQDNEHKVAGQPSTNVIVFTLQIGYNSSQLD